jgi:hypothetical protein
MDIMNIDLIKKIIDAKVVRGLDKDLPDAHLFGWDPEPHITEYELINVKLDNSNNYRCECAYIDLGEKNVRRIKYILIGLEEYNSWLSENRELFINSILK